MSISSPSFDLVGVIGFNGSVRNGVLLHPNDIELITPLGSTVCIRDLNKNKQQFLQAPIINNNNNNNNNNKADDSKNPVTTVSSSQSPTLSLSSSSSSSATPSPSNDGSGAGHPSSMSCLALSVTGRYLACGHVSHPGFAAPLFIWDLTKRQLLHSCTLHKGRVADLSFSSDEKWLVSIGGREENKVIVWEVESGEAVAAAMAANDTAITVKCINQIEKLPNQTSNYSPFRFVTAGSYHVRVWTLDRIKRKLLPVDCAFGQLKRVITSISISADNEYAYCGTTTGDLLKVSIPHHLYKGNGPAKSNFPQGITCTQLTSSGDILIGTGDGTIALLSSKDLKVIRQRKILGAVTSIVLNSAGDHFFVGSSSCELYLVSLATMEMELRATGHKGKINQIAFPKNYSKLFATAGSCDIRVWRLSSLSELLRINVPSEVCLCLVFAPDGHSILSGWSDGAIRAFSPQTGSRLYIIKDAHVGGVSALAMSTDSRCLVSGGENGHIRVWNIESRGVVSMIASMKEHQGRVNSVVINNKGTECISGSSDGSAIVWSLVRYSRISCLFASTQFRSLAYHPEEFQLLTAGSDRKLYWWALDDAAPIRVIDSSNAAINAVQISGDGEYFISAGEDRLVRLYGYDSGECLALARGHAASITHSTLAPNGEEAITLGEDGAICIWKIKGMRNKHSVEAIEEQKEFFTKQTSTSKKSSKSKVQTNTNQYNNSKTNTDTLVSSLPSRYHEEEKESCILSTSTRSNSSNQSNNSNNPINKVGNKRMTK